MSALKWTTEPPKAPGFYFLREQWGVKKKRWSRLQVVEVWYSGDSLQIDGRNVPDGVNSLHIPGCVLQWSGPIPEPETGEEE